MFKLAIDHYRFPGADLERELRQHWSLADFDIIGSLKYNYLLIGTRESIRKRAQELASNLEREEEVPFYIGLSRGHVYQYETYNSTKVRCIHFDYAALLNSQRQIILSYCLNFNNPLNRNLRGIVTYQYDNRETCQALTTFIDSHCMAKVS